MGLFRIMGIGLVFAIFTSCQNRQETLNQRLLVPLYVHPALDRAPWDKLLQEPPPIPTFVIINPNDGPGSRRDLVYDRWIHALRQKGYRILGYITSDWLTKPAQEVRQEMQLYGQFYGWDPFEGFFIDEFSSSSNPDPVSIARDYKREMITHNISKILVVNPGTVIPTEVFQHVDWAVTAEVKKTDLETYWSYIFQSRKLPQECLIIYAVENWNDFFHLRARITRQGVKCFYISHERDNSYRVLSEFWTQLGR